jgi:hypothetical protein
LTAGRLDVVTPLAGGGAARVLVAGCAGVGAASAARAVGSAVLALFGAAQLLEPLEHEVHGEVLQRLPSSGRCEAHALGDLVG